MWACPTPIYDPFKKPKNLETQEISKNRQQQCLNYSYMDEKDEYLI